MKEIKIDVKQKIASVEGTPIIVCGNSDYTMSFTFDDEWKDENNKVARFSFIKNGLKSFIDMPIHDNICQVPVLVGIGLVRVGAYAGNLRTTTGAKIKCQKSILCDDAEEMAEPFENLYEELLKKIDEIATSGVITPDDVLQALNDSTDNEPQKVYSANVINEEVVEPTTMWFNKLVAEKENISNKSTSIDNESTDKEYSTAKAVYDFGLRVIEAHQEQVDAQMNELEERLMAYIGGIENGSY